MQSTPFRVRHGIIVETSNNTSTAIVANNQVLTGSASNALVDLATTWNTTGNPTAIKLNVTNTASGANSALMDLQVGGSSRFRVAANGNVGISTNNPIQALSINTNQTTSNIEAFSITGNSSGVNPNLLMRLNRGYQYTGGSGTQIIFENQGNEVSNISVIKRDFQQNTGGHNFEINIKDGAWVLLANNFAASNTSAILTNNSYLGFAPNTFNTISSSRPSITDDIRLYRDGSSILAQRLGSNAQSFRLYGTYTDVSNYERINFVANSTGHYVLGEEGGTGSARPLYLGANNAAMVTIAANGNFGIGTVTPSAKLHIVGQNDTLFANSSTTMFIQGTSAYNSNNAGSGIRFEGLYNSANLVTTFGAIWVKKNNTTDGDYGAYMAFGTRGNGSGAESLERMRISSTGNIGIGLTSPAYKLHVNGDIGLHDASSIRLLQSNTEVGRLTTNAGELALVGAAANAFVSFYTNDGAGVFERMRITSGGNVGIGTTSPSSFGKFAVNSTTNVYGFKNSPTNTLAHIGGNAYSEPDLFIQKPTNTAGAGAIQAGPTLQFGVVYGTNPARTVLNNGNILFSGWDGSNFITAASITSQVENTFTTNAGYGNLLFATNNGSSNPSERMRITAGGQVAIGTSSAFGADRLTVYGSQTIIAGPDTNSYLNLRGSNSYLGSEGPLIFTTATIDRMRITSGGNVGIGTSSPNALLTLEAASPRISFFAADSTYALYRTETSMVLNSPGYSAVTSESGTILRTRTGAILFETGAAGTASERMQIAANGNVGIATSTPSAKLDINSDVIRVRTAKTPASPSDTGNQGDICWDANYIYVCTAANTWVRASLSTW